MDGDLPLIKIRDHRYTSRAQHLRRRASVRGKGKKWEHTARARLRSPTWVTPLDATRSTGRDPGREPDGTFFSSEDVWCQIRHISAYPCTRSTNQGERRVPGRGMPVTRFDL
jgi:hypothetical protein